LKGDSSATVVAGYARQLSHPAYENLIKSETFLRRLVPALLVLFLAIAGLARWISLQSQAEVIRVQTNTEMHFIAELIEQRLLTLPQDEGKAYTPSQIQNFLSDIIPAKYRADGRSIVLTARDGSIIASIPYRPENNGKQLDTILGDVLLLTTFGERAEARSIQTAIGEPALAVHRLLAKPFSGVTLIQPESFIYADWKRYASINVGLGFVTWSILLVQVDV